MLDGASVTGLCVVFKDTGNVTLKGQRAPALSALSSLVF